MNEGFEPGASRSSRRQFLERSARLSLLAGVATIPVISGCKSDEDEGEKKVSPPEDLMQEHGVLNRILLVYDHYLQQFGSNQSFSFDPLNKSAQIIRSFVEDYHEKQEENYLFPRFEKAHQLTDLVSVLRQQHQAGRTITDQVLQLTASSRPAESDRQKLKELLNSFLIMYRPHEAREDTVLFPAFRKIVSQHEYDSLGEEFEKNEQKFFGKDGFEKIVAQVTEIEKALGINDLAQFTPRI